VGLTTRKETVEYHVGALPVQYDLTATAVKYERGLASGGIVAQLGTNSLDIGNQHVNGPLVSFAWSHQLARRSRITLSAGSEFTDAGALLNLRVGRVNAETLQEILPTPDPEQLKRVALRYEINGLRTYFAVGVTAMQEDYQNQSNLDNTGHDVQMSFERKLTDRLTIGGNVGKLARDFKAVGLVRDNISALRIERRMGRSLLFSFRAESAGRNAGAADAFDRLFYELRLTYARGGRRMAGGRF
jgi:hypothetical protein